MRKILSLVSAVAALFCFFACSNNAAHTPGEAPELLYAVPSDALCVGVFGHCDNALDRLTDSTNVLRQLDYGKLSRGRAVVALCNVGSIFPLLVLEAGKTGSDTLAAARSLLSQADSLRLSSALVPLKKHNALLLCASPTVITVVRRHLASDSSILDAPYFEGALLAMGGSDAVAYRNSGAARLNKTELCSIGRKQLNDFLRDAAEWTVAVGDDIYPVQPQTEKYFCNFLASVPDGQSKFGQACPVEAEFIIDLPVASFSDRREAYETWLDARVELENYRRQIVALKKKSGKSPLDWEKEVDVREVVYLATPAYRLNMVRVAKSSKTDGVVSNPYTGFVKVLYGEPFSDSDSCMVRLGNWIVSGDRAVLDTLTLGSAKLQGWPSKAAAVAATRDMRITCNNEKINIWHSNQ